MDKKYFGKYTLAVDEIGIQTLFMKSNFKNLVYKPSSLFIHNNLRYIDFDRGNGCGSPHILL